MVKAPAKPQLHAAFGAFWAAYPRRPGDARAPAGVLFTALVQAGEDAGALVASAGVFADHCRAQGIAAKFIPMARTWLHQRRFEDFAASASDSAPSPQSPAADHPLAFLVEDAGEAAFASWIAPLRVENRAGSPTVIARTQLALDRVRKDWGRPIAARLGPVGWIVERT